MRRGLGYKEDGGVINLKNLVPGVTPFHEEPCGIIFHANCLDIMKLMPDNCIDLTVTSPPYDNLRTYRGYSFDFESIARQLYRITKKGGVVVWVVGDETVNGSESGTSFRQALFFKETGFNLHDTMIYEKVNFANPSHNRYHQIFEYMFVFTKEYLKTFNPIKDKINKWEGCFGKNTWRNKEGVMIERAKPKHRKFGMRTNIWKLKTAGQENICQPIIHPASFPEKLAQDHILSWSNPGDLCFDPMLGSGTVAVAAKELGRRFIACEIESTYIDIAVKRLRQGVLNF